MNLMHKLLPTTVVGSYPAVKGTGLLSRLDPMKHALETAVADQVAAGIDIISTGQVRGDMIGSFTTHLPGIRGQQVTGKVSPSPKPMTVADTRYALSVHPKVKGIITGPSTIAHGLQIATPMYRNRDELILDIAQALAAEAQALEEAGVMVLQIDEPILSTGVANLHTAQHAVGMITSVLRIPTCLHVCGDLAAVIDDLRRMPVNILDIESAGNPGNLDSVARTDLKGKMLGFGAVDSASPEVEPQEVIEKRIGRGVELFGAERLLIDPDCGLRMLPRAAAFEKLSRMAAAAAAVRSAVLE
ncbi:MAG: methionine synthase [Methanomicrobiales archaeon]|nr:methionine synthase [Methanomicrobiales archaeon]